MPPIIGNAESRAAGACGCSGSSARSPSKAAPAMNISEIGGTQYLYSQEAIQSAGLIAHTTSAAPARTNGTAKNLRANDPGERKQMRAATKVKLSATRGHPNTASRSVKSTT